VSGTGGDSERVADPMAFFAGSTVALGVFQTIEGALGKLGEHEVRVGKSQVAFRRHRGFAYLWRPAQYVKSDVPVVLSLALRHRLESPRFKEVIHPAPRTWMHHLELRSGAELDDEVLGWLAEAYAEAGSDVGEGSR
jgi:hypothetical protein